MQVLIVTVYQLNCKMYPGFYWRIQLRLKTEKIRKMPYIGISINYQVPKLAIKHSRSRTRKSRHKLLQRGENSEKKQSSQQIEQHNQLLN